MLSDQVAEQPDKPIDRFEDSGTMALTFAGPGASTGDARAQFLKIMAFDKNPRAYFLDSRNRRIIVTDAEIKADKLEILKVIPEGKKEMPYADFLRGQK